MNLSPAAANAKKSPSDSRRLLYERLCRSLSRTLAMPEAELRPLLNFDSHLLSATAGRQLQEEGGTGRPKILVSGWACQQRIMEDGRRQIFSFLIPGDAFNCRQSGTANANIVALTGMTLLDATQLEQSARLPGAHPGLVDYFEKMEQRRIRLLFNHIVRLGGDTTYQRLRGLLEELFQRLGQAGLCYNGSVQFPLTQETLADSLGVSAVHINRVLQKMRSDGAVELQDGRLALHNDSNRAA